MHFAKVFYSSEKLHRMMMENDTKPLKGHVDGLNMSWEEKIFQCFCILSQTFCMCSLANSKTLLHIIFLPFHIFVSMPPYLCKII